MNLSAYCSLITVLQNNFCATFQEMEVVCRQYCRYSKWHLIPYCTWKGFFPLERWSLILLPLTNTACVVQYVLLYCTELELWHSSWLLTADIQKGPDENSFQATSHLSVLRRIKRINILHPGTLHWESVCQNRSARDECELAPLWRSIMLIMLATNSNESVIFGIIMTALPCSQITWWRGMFRLSLFKDAALGLSITLRP